MKLQDDVMESEWKSRCERLEVQIKAVPQHFIVDVPEHA